MAALATSSREEEQLEAQLERHNRDEAACARELQEAVAALGSEAQRAARGEAAAKAAQQRLEELQRLVRELELRAVAADEEEASWRDMAQAVSRLHQEDVDATAAARAARAARVEHLRAQLAAARRTSAGRSVEAERQRRLAADERCMVLQAASSYVLGEWGSPEAMGQLLRGDSCGSCGSAAADDRVEALGDRVLQLEAAAHREEKSRLLACCNEELAQKSGRPSPDDAFDGESLARLLATLEGEGLCVTKAAPSSALRDPRRAARLRRQLLSR